MRMLVIMTMALMGSMFAYSGELTKNVNFALDKWVELNSTDGPVTIHRFRIIEQKKSGFTKSALFRPGNSENLMEIQIQIEYSNDSSRDWDADIEIGWYDAQGKLIDGYNDTESINEDERKEEITVTLSTLKYGIEVAKKLKLHIEYHRD